MLLNRPIWKTRQTRQGHVLASSLAGRDDVWQRGKTVAALAVIALAGCVLGQPLATLAQTPLRPPAVRKFLSGSPTGNLNNQRLTPPDTIEDAGDSYIAAGKRVRLLRSRNEVVVRHAPAAAAQVQALNKTKAALGLAPAVPGGRRFGKAARLELLRSANKAARVNNRDVSRSAAVDYAYPVLVDPQSGKRMIPTDELLVGLAEGVTIADLAAEFATAGVTVVSAKGAPRMKAYLLRLNNPKISDPLGIAQTLSANPKLR
jgi:hypothetical protein